MKTNHTQGPWTALSRGDSRQSASHCVVQSKSGRTLCQALDYNDLPEGEARANAKLMSAAPALLAALRRMLDAFHEDPLSANRDDAVMEAYSAIVSATFEAA